MPEGRAEQGYNHGRYLMVFYKGLALHPAYVDGWVEGCLHRVALDRPDGARALREYLTDPEMRGHVVDVLKSEMEVRAGRSD
jgi:hypothetical protein